MSDKIKITCPRCGHKWEQSLGELEKMEIIYRGAKKEKSKEKKVSQYRAVCPVDGTYIILEVEED